MGLSSHGLRQNSFGRRLCGMRQGARIAAITTVVLSSALVAVPAQAAFPGRNGRIVYSSAAGDIYTMRPDGSGVRRLTNVASTDRATQGSWSPDSRHIVYALLRTTATLATQQVWVMNSDGSNKHRLFADPFFTDWGPKYSPDGSQIVLNRCRPDFSACAIYRVDSAGRHLTGLTAFRTEIDDFWPRYSPDGRQIAFSSFSRGGVQGAVYVMRADGSRIRRLTPAWLGAFTPDWSPDGRRLVFQDHCCAGSGESIWRINADGTGLHRLTRSGANHSFTAIWSPAGDKIAFDLWTPDLSSVSLWEMRPDGSGAHQVRADATPSGWGSAR